MIRGVVRTAAPWRYSKAFIRPIVSTAATAHPPPPMTLERLASIVELGLKNFENQVNKRLQAIETKFGHNLEYQLRREVARVHGQPYAKQKADECVINLVAHLPLQEPTSPDPYSTVIFTARKICEELITKNVPIKFMKTLAAHLKIKTSDVFMADGSLNFKRIRRHPLAKGNCSSLDQLEKFFELRTSEMVKQVSFLASSQGSGLLFIIFLASPESIFGTNKLKLYNSLEFDFQGRVTMFRNQTMVTGNLDIGEVNTSLDLGDAIEQLALRLNVLKLVLEMSMKDEVNLRVTKIGRIFVPKEILKQSDLDNVHDSVKNDALKRGFSIHLHRL